MESMQCTEDTHNDHGNHGSENRGNKAIAIDWVSLPKVELHRHLEGAIRLSTYLELSPPELKLQTLEEARNYYCMAKPCETFTECMNLFGRTQRLLCSEERVERITYEAVEDCVRDGIKVLELRYSPTYINLGHPHMTPHSIHQAVLRGVERACAKYRKTDSSHDNIHHNGGDNTNNNGDSDNNGDDNGDNNGGENDGDGRGDDEGGDQPLSRICVGLIGIIDRFMSLEEATEAMQFIINNKDTFVGVDLANDESKFDAMVFSPLFLQAKAAGLHVTIHTGEVDAPEAATWVKNAIEHMGAERIGHGIFVVKDPEVVKYARDKGVVFEVSPSSNFLSGQTKDLATHPIAHMVANDLNNPSDSHHNDELDVNTSSNQDNTINSTSNEGLLVTINTDDPGLFDITLSSELKLCHEVIGMSERQIRDCLNRAYHSSFIPEEVRSKYYCPSIPSNPLST